MANTDMLTLMTAMSTEINSMQEKLAAVMKTSISFMERNHSLERRFNEMERTYNEKLFTLQKLVSTMVVRNALDKSKASPSIPQAPMQQIVTLPPQPLQIKPPVQVKQEAPQPAIGTIGQQLLTAAVIQQQSPVVSQPTMVRFPALPVSNPASNSQSPRTIQNGTPGHNSPQEMPTTLSPTELQNSSTKHSSQGIQISASMDGVDLPSLLRAATHQHGSPSNYGLEEDDYSIEPAMKRTRIYTPGSNSYKIMVTGVEKFTFNEFIDHQVVPPLVELCKAGTGPKVQLVITPSAEQILGKPTWLKEGILRLFQRGPYFSPERSQEEPVRSQSFLESILDITEKDPDAWDQLYGCHYVRTNIKIVTKKSKLGETIGICLACLREYKGSRSPFIYFKLTDGSNFKSHYKQHGINLKIAGSYEQVAGLKFHSNSTGLKLESNSPEPLKLEYDEPSPINPPLDPIEQFNLNSFNALNQNVSLPTTTASKQLLHKSRSSPVPVASPPTMAAAASLLNMLDFENGMFRANSSKPSAFNILNGTDANAGAILFHDRRRRDHPEESYNYSFQEFRDVREFPPIVILSQDMPLVDQVLITPTDYELGELVPSKMKLAMLATFQRFYPQVNKTGISMLQERMQELIHENKSWDFVQECPYVRTNLRIVTKKSRLGEAVGICYECLKMKRDAPFLYLRLSDGSNYRKHYATHL